MQRYNEERLAGLQSRVRQGRKPILSESEQQLVAQRLKERPREDDVCSLQGIDFQKFWGIGAASPQTGQAEAILLPVLNTAIINQFLDQFSRWLATSTPP